MFTGELMEKVPVSIPREFCGLMMEFQHFRLGLETYEKDRRTGHPHPRNPQP